MGKKLPGNIKTISLLWMTLSYIVFYTCYNSSNIYSSTYSDLPSYFLSWEKNIPFISWMIVPYMSSGLLFCFVFFLCKNRNDLFLLVKRINFITILSTACFFIYPLKFSFKKPVVNNTILNVFFNILNRVDSPFNQFPSLHIAYAVIFLIVFHKELSGTKKWLLQSWVILLIISTLTVYQHHLIDIPGGILAALLSLIIFTRKKDGIREQNIFTANFYFLISTIIAILIIFFPGSFYILFYPLFTFLLVGIIYFKNAPNCFIKNKGKFSWISIIFFAPYLLSYFLIWKFFRNKKSSPYSEIFDGIFVGRRLSSKEASDFKKCYDLVVFDLSPELNENRIFRNSTYYYFPMLDISPPVDIIFKEALKKLNEVIDKKKSNEKIYVHCTMGYSRSLLLIASYLKKYKNFSKTGAISFLKEKHPKVILHSYLREYI